MKLSKWNPFRELSTITEQIACLFEDLLFNGDRDFLGLYSMDDLRTPAVEIKKTDTELFLKAKIPGMSIKDSLKTRIEARKTKTKNQKLNLLIVSN